MLTIALLLIVSPYLKSLVVGKIFSRLGRFRRMLFVSVGLLEVLCVLPLMTFINTRDPIIYSFSLFVVTFIATALIGTLYAVVVGSPFRWQQDYYRNLFIPLLPGLLVWIFWFKYLFGGYDASLCG